MFQSGPWRGFWEQPGFGRQFMENMTLEFESGRIRGRGRDVVGLFTFQGEYTAEGIISLVKQYVGKHYVLYTGSYDGEGVIFGQWHVSENQSGPFAFQHQQEETTEGLPIHDL